MNQIIHKAIKIDTSKHLHFKTTNKFRSAQRVQPLRNQTKNCNNSRTLIVQIKLNVCLRRTKFYTNLTVSNISPCKTATLECRNKFRICKE